MWAVVHFTYTTEGIDCFYKTGRVTVGVLYRKIEVHILARYNSRKFNSCRPDVRLNTNQNFTENAIPLYYKDQLHNPYPTAFSYWNGMVLHFYQQQESSTTKTVHKVINKGLKTYV